MRQSKQYLLTNSACLSFFTNSITIDDVVFVVDGGKVKEKVCRYAQIALNLANGCMLLYVSVTNCVFTLVVHLPMMSGEK